MRDPVLVYMAILRRPQSEHRRLLTLRSRKVMRQSERFANEWVERLIGSK